MIVVEGVGPTDKVLDLFDPRWVVNETLEGFATLVNLLQVEAIAVAIVVAVYVALPLLIVPDRAAARRWRR